VEMLLTKHDHVVQAFAPDGSDQALSVGILPGGFGRGQNLLDAHAFDSSTECLAEDADPSLLNHVVTDGEMGARMTSWRRTGDRFQSDARELRRRGQGGHGPGSGSVWPKRAGHTQERTILVRSRSPGIVPTLPHRRGGERPSMPFSRRFGSSRRARRSRRP